MNGDVLIIDDDKLFVELIIHALEPRVVRIAYTMKQALEMIDQSPPDTILLDLTLTDSDTVETLSRIQELRSRSKDAIVIVITGSPQVSALKHTAKESGADEVLSKNHGFFEALSAALLNPPRTKQAGSFEQVVSEIESTVREITGAERIKKKMK